MSGISVTIQGGAGISASVSTKQVFPSLQVSWDDSTDPEKNTFVDANDLEIATFLDFSTVAYAILNSFPNPLAEGEKELIGAFIDSQIDSGNWNLFDSKAFMNLADATNSLWDVKRGSAMTAVNGPTHTAHIGYAFNGVDQYIDSNYNPSTDAINYKSLDAILGGFIVTNNSPTLQSAAIIGDDIGNSFMGQQPNNTRVRAQFNGAGLAVSYTGESFMANNSLYLAHRDSSQIRIFKSGSQVVTATRAGGAISNNNLIIGRNFGSVYLDGVISSVLASAAIDFNHSDYNSNLVILNTGLASL